MRAGEKWRENTASVALPNEAIAFVLASPVGDYFAGARAVSAEGDRSPVRRATTS